MGKIISSSMFITKSSSSRYGNIGNTFLNVFLFGPSTQFILNDDSTFDNCTKSFGKSFSLFGNSTIAKFKYTMSGLTVLFNTAFTT